MATEVLTFWTYDGTWPHACIVWSVPYIYDCHTLIYMPSKDSATHEPPGSVLYRCAKAHKAWKRTETYVASPQSATITLFYDGKSHYQPLMWKNLPLYHKFSSQYVTGRKHLSSEAKPYLVDYRRSRTAPGRNLRAITSDEAMVHKRLYTANVTRYKEVLQEATLKGPEHRQAIIDRWKQLDEDLAAREER